MDCSAVELATGPGGACWKEFSDGESVVAIVVVEAERSRTG